MSDTLITIIGIFLAAILMFIFPLMTVSSTQDDISQVAVQSLVAEFVNNAATKGKITQDDYNNFISKLYATANTYDVQLEHKIMTVNPNKGETNHEKNSCIYSCSYNDYKLAVLGNNTLIPVIDEDLEPDFTVGDLLIVKNSNDIDVGDVIYYYVVYHQVYFVPFHLKVYRNVIN